MASTIIKQQYAEPSLNSNVVYWSVCPSVCLSVTLCKPFSLMDQDLIRIGFVAAFVFETQFQ